MAGNSQWQLLNKKESQYVEIYWDGVEEYGRAQIGISNQPFVMNDSITNLKLIKGQKVTINGYVFYRSFVSDAGVTDTKTAYIHYRLRD